MDIQDALTPREAVQIKVESERMRQDRIWGIEHDAQHTDNEWFQIVVKQMGALSLAMLVGEKYPIEREAIQVMATLSAWLEHRN